MWATWRKGVEEADGRRRRRRRRQGQSESVGRGVGVYVKVTSGNALTMAEREGQRPGVAQGEGRSGRCEWPAGGDRLALQPNED